MKIVNFHTNKIILSVITIGMIIIILKPHEVVRYARRHGWTNWVLVNQQFLNTEFLDGDSKVENE